METRRQDAFDQGYRQAQKDLDNPLKFGKNLRQAYERGYAQALNDNNILHGKKAKDFLKKMEEKEHETDTKFKKKIDKLMKDISDNDSKIRREMR